MNENGSTTWWAEWGRVLLAWALGVMLFAGTAREAQAQWTTSGSNTYTQPDNNVGIGTSTPVQKLDVLGNIRMFTGHVLTGHLVTDAQGGPLVLNSGPPDASNVGGIWFRRTTTLGNDFPYVDLMRLTDTGNLGIGTVMPSTKLHVVGDVTVTGNIAAKYQDVAEWVPAPRALAPGTVVVLDETQPNQVLPSSQAYDTKVAGVISSQPGLLLGEAGTDKVKVATTGRVKVKADARHRPIHTGDLLVTGEHVGTAIASEPMEVNGRRIHQPGTILGKALEPLSEGEGEILVLLTLQ